MQSNEPFPDDTGHRRRSLFGRGSAEPEDVRIEEALAGYQRVLEERLDRGLAAIQSSAVQLMRDVASEMWRSSGGDTAETQSSILQFLSRDQAIRGLISHSDERFQALAVRTDRLEDALQQVNRSNAQLTEHIARSARALADVAQSPALQNVDGVREQIEQVERHIASTIAYIAERDRELVENIRAQVQENGNVVASEAERIVEAMQGYVSGGVDTMGRLAQRMEQHIETATAQDDDLTDRIHAQIQTTLGEQIQLLYERLGIEARTLADALASHETWMSRTLEEAADRTDEQWLQQNEAIRESARIGAEQVTHVLEARVMGLAQLVRSDSEALRQRLVDNAAAQDEAIGRMLDERLIRVTEAVDAATQFTVEESSRRIGEVTERAIDGRAETISLALDRNLVVLKEKMDADLTALGDRTASVVETAIGAGMQANADRLSTSVDAIDQARMSFERMQAEGEAGVGRAIDQRIGALAKMIRSDNQALAQRIDQQGESDASRQALRAVKELQANLGNEVLGAMDRKFSMLADQLHHETQSMAESFATSADVLTRKIDRIQSQTGGREMQTAIEKMGDAMHALAAIGGQGPPADDRIDLE